MNGVLPYRYLNELGVPNPGPASFDLEHGEIFRIHQPYWDATFRYLSPEERDQFTVSPDSFRQNLIPFRGKWIRGGMFFTEQKIPDVAEQFDQFVGTRSNIARAGMMAKVLKSVDYKKRNTPLLLRTYETTIQTPDCPISQMVLMTRGTKRLTSNEIRQALKRGEIRVPADKIKDYDLHGGILLGFGKHFTGYTGERIKIGDLKQQPAKYFETCSTNGELGLEGKHFYLGYTEDIFIGPKYMGMLFGASDPREKLVHLNAPIVHPTSEGGQTLEIYAKIDCSIYTAEPSCKLVLYHLAEEFTFPETLRGTNTNDGRYCDQRQLDEPRGPGLHKWRPKQ